MASLEARRQVRASRPLGATTGQGLSSLFGTGSPLPAAGRAWRQGRPPIQSTNPALGAGEGSGGGAVPAPVPASDPPPNPPRGGRIAAVATPPCKRHHAKTREKHREHSRPPLTGREQTRQADLKCEESGEEKKCREERGRLQHPLVEVRSLA